MRPDIPAWRSFAELGTRNQDPDPLRPPDQIKDDLRLRQSRDGEMARPRLWGRSEKASRRMRQEPR
jgi:hypothetical protein